MPLSDVQDEVAALPDSHIAGLVDHHHHQFPNDESYTLAPRGFWPLVAF
jgi:hypothetical protein